MITWLFLGLLTALFYSLMTVTTRYILRSKEIHAIAYSPFQLFFSLSFITLAFFLFNKTYIKPEFWVAGFVIAPFIYLAGVLWSLAAHTEEASFISPLLQTNTLFLLLIGFFFLGEKLVLKDVLGIVLIFLGGFLVVLKGFKKPRLSNGFFLVILSVLIDSIGKTIVKLTVKEGAAALSFTVILFGFLISLFVAFFYKRREFENVFKILPKKKKYFYAIFLKGFLSFAATVSFILALQFGLLSKVGAVSNTAPLFAVLFGFVFLKETDLKKKLVASLIILIGLFLVS